MAKRYIAMLIDSFAFGLILAICKFGLDALEFRSLEIMFALIVLVLSLRDVIFANASFGKKCVGISVYDLNWKKPKIAVLIKRSFSTATLGMAILFKSRFSEEGTISFIDWERDKLGTMVIDDKVFEELRLIAEAQKGDFAANMTALYNKYLREMYLK